MNNNSVIAVPSSNPLQASAVVSDVLAGSLLAFDLDMNLGVLSLQFSETMDISTFRATDITLQSVEDVTLGVAVASHTLSGEVSVSRQDSTLVNLTLLEVDVEAVKQAVALATQQTNTFLAIPHSLIEDQSGVAGT